MTTCLSPPICVCVWVFEDVPLCACHGLCLLAVRTAHRCPCHVWLQPQCMAFNLQGSKNKCRKAHLQYPAMAGRHVVPHSYTTAAHVHRLHSTIDHIHCLPLSSLLMLMCAGIEGAVDGIDSRTQLMIAISAPLMYPGYYVPIGCVDTPISQCVWLADRCAAFAINCIGRFNLSPSAANAGVKSGRRWRMFLIHIKNCKINRQNRSFYSIL